MKPKSLPRGTAWMPSSPCGERRLQAEEEDHLRERQRDHREIDALAADREQAGHHAEQRGARGAGRIASSGGKPQTLAACAVDVARGAEEHGVAEGQQAAEADQQVEGAGEQREAQRLHQEHRVDDERRDREDAIARADHAAMRACSVTLRRRSSSAFLPNRPAGLISSTIAMMTKITVFDASG